MAARDRATAVGFIAVVLWGALALLTTFSSGLPPFQLTALTFATAFLLMLTRWLLAGINPIQFARQPLRVWALGVGGLFGYHLCYFVALANAPAVEASMIAYFWPLLIVVFSALIAGKKLDKGMQAGVIAALLGSWLLLWKPGAGFAVEYLTGYLAAMLAALIWAGYSVLSARLKTVATDTIGWFCGATALIAWLFHLQFEQTHWPLSNSQWLGVLLLGAGPVGVAFLCWDFGVKRGDIQLIGVLSYAAPLISTLLLIVVGEAEGSINVWLGTGLIVGGAWLASRQRRSEVKTLA